MCSMKVYTSRCKELLLFCKARCLHNFNTTDIHVQLKCPLSSQTGTINIIYVKLKDVNTVGNKKKEKIQYLHRTSHSRRHGDSRVQNSYSMIYSLLHTKERGTLSYSDFHNIPHHTLVKKIKMLKKNMSMNSI